MKIILMGLIFSGVLASCADNTNTTPANSIDTTKNHQDTVPPAPVAGNNLPATTDTTVEFSIEDISAEGSEVKARYIKDTLRSAVWNIYGETGQAVINYNFLSDGTIEATEKEYAYKTDLNDERAVKDMKLKKTISYKMDKNGTLLTKVNDKQFMNVFPNFRDNVPMTFNAIKPR